MDNIIFIAKGDSNSNLPTYKVMDIFTKSEDMDEIRDAVVKAKERLYVSWASVDWRDKQGELIPIDDIIKQQDILLERNGPITDNHTNRVIGQTLAYKVMKHPRTQTMGVLHLNKIWAHSPLDEQVWKETQDGTRTGSSVGGTSSDSHMALDPQTGMPMKVLEGFQQYETASVYKPANMFALNEAVSMVAKGMDVNKSAPTFEVLQNYILECVQKTGYFPTYSEAITYIGTVMKRDALYEELKKVDAEATEQYMNGIDMEGKEHPELSKETIAQLVRDHLNEDPKYYSTHKSENVIKQETHTVDKTEMVTMDEVQKAEFDNLKKGFEDLSKKYDDLIKASAKKEEEPEEKEPKEEDKEAKKAEDKKPKDEKPEAENDKVTFKSEDEKPESVNDKVVFKKELEALKAEVASVKKSVETISTPRPMSDVAKSEVDNTALEIAMGTKKMSWEDVNNKYGPKSFL